KMLREGYYGITLTLAAVTVRPMRTDAFAFSTGRITLDHSRERVELVVPGDGTRRYTIGGLSAGQNYSVGSATIPADGRGQITYLGDAGVTQLIKID
ncbi:MAG: hypothetical protein Q8M65_00885, partial [Rhodoglobus sp.]|nr:hypothetical protein [Rhodoglobus sp.]